MKTILKVSGLQSSPFHAFEREEVDGGGWAWCVCFFFAIKKIMRGLPFRTQNSTCWQEGETSLSLQRNWGAEKRNLNTKDKQRTCLSFADPFIVIATLLWTPGYILPPLNALRKVIFPLCIISFPHFVVAFVAKKRMNEAHFARVVP